MSTGDRDSEREGMIASHLVARGLDDPRLLAAFRAVPREDFLPSPLASCAYVDRPLPIGDGQTISQPYVVALMCAALDLEGDEKVLEVGTGSGYGAAILAQLAREVHTVERRALLAEEARARLAHLGLDGVQVHEGDGSRGWPPAAPFDAIVATAAGPVVPESPRAQLAPGGRLVIPVGGREDQRLLLLTRLPGDRILEKDLGAVRFVPLEGEEGWPAAPDEA